jgi:Na+-driven multidrug efflux pump
MGVISALMFVLAEALATPMSFIFTRYDSVLLARTKEAFFFYSFSFLFSGFAIFGSSFFTALNNGPVSAIISFLRTLLFQVLAVLLLPLMFTDPDKKVIGIWISIVVAEFLAVIITGIFILAKRKKYHY